MRVSNTWTCPSESATARKLVCTGFHCIETILAVALVVVGIVACALESACNDGPEIPDWCCCGCFCAVRTSHNDTALSLEEDAAEASTASERGWNCTASAEPAWAERAMTSLAPAAFEKAIVLVDKAELTDVEVAIPFNGIVGMVVAAADADGVASKQKSRIVPSEPAIPNRLPDAFQETLRDRMRVEPHSMRSHCVIFIVAVVVVSTLSLYPPATAVIARSIQHQQPIK